MSDPAPVIRTVKAGRGASWFGEAFALFRKSPGAWMGSALVLLLAMLASSSGPLLVGLAFDIVAPVLIGGLMLGCERQSRGESLRFEDLWAAFKSPHLVGLLVIGVVGALGITLVDEFLPDDEVIESIVAAFMAGDLDTLSSLLAKVLEDLLLVLVILTPLTMALWYAPALIVLADVRANAALLASFRACLRNLPALSVNGLVALPIAIVATVPLLLGWLVATPVLIVSMYTGYRDLFIPASTAPIRVPA